MKPLTLGPGEFSYSRIVQFAETDLAGIAHFSVFFRFMEEAEHALWRAAGLSIAGDDLHWPRVSASCEYNVPLRFEDELTVMVRAGFGRRRIQYRFEMRRAATVAAVGIMTSVCTRANAAGTLESTAIPHEVIERLRRTLG